MRIFTPKLLTGTMLGVVLCAIAGTPAIARPLSQGQLTPNTTEAESVQPEPGEVVRLVSNFATIEMNNGETKTIPVARWKLDQLEPGTNVWVAYGRIVAIDSQDESLNNNILAQADYATAMQGRVANITGSIARVKLRNGDTVNIGLSRAQLGQIRPGTQVMVNDRRIVEMNSMSNNRMKPDMMMNPMSNNRMKPNMMRMGTGVPMEGRVASITGNIASIELENGDTVNIGLSRAQLGQIIPGTQVMVNDGRIVDMNPMSNNRMKPNMMRMGAGAPMEGRVASITGNIASIELENGDTVNIGLSRAQLGQIIPGTQVMVNDGRIMEIESMSR
ncbi:MAG: hypothetical protein RIM23_26575 [Coleofasciculus sp. G3-WIS-01]|uniref:hypothetical protein n=1 Tax=Coleofasciculus sp. G3-WIS-01 TaxID=3069528 RepID=UPI0032FAA97A